MVRVVGGSSSDRSPSSRLGRDVVMMAVGSILTAIVMNLLNNNNNTPNPSGGLYQSSLLQLNNNSPAMQRAAEEKVSSSSSSSSSTSSVQVVVDGIEPAEGWHPIHVFYGKMNHILDPIPSEKFWVPLDTTTTTTTTSTTTTLQQQKQNHREWFSQHGQDVAVMKALDFPQNAFFVDLAANDAVWASNTFVMEQSFGWKGICIEPNPIYWYRLAFRKCHALGTIVGANDFEEVQVVLGTEHNGPYSGIVGKEFDNKKAPTAVNRYTAGLKTLLKRFHAPAMIDYLSLDVEGAETFIMKGFPFDEYKFKVLTVERPKDELQRILTSHGYTKILDLKRGDTLWAHDSVRDFAVANLAKNPDEIKTKVIQHWPPHVANKA